MNSKKIFSIFLTAVLLLASLAACGSADTAGSAEDAAPPAEETAAPAPAETVVRRSKVQSIGSSF